MCSLYELTPEDISYLFDPLSPMLKLTSGSDDASPILCHTVVFFSWLESHPRGLTLAGAPSTIYLVQLTPDDNPCHEQEFYKGLVQPSHWHHLLSLCSQGELPRSALAERQAPRVVPYLQQPVLRVRCGFNPYLKWYHKKVYISDFLFLWVFPVILLET